MPVYSRRCPSGILTYYTRRTAFTQPSFSGLLVICAYPVSWVSSSSPYLPTVHEIGICGERWKREEGRV